MNSIPNEIIFKIFDYLQADNLAIIKNTNKKNYNLVYSHTKTEVYNDKDLKDIYFKTYMVRKCEMFIDGEWIDTTPWRPPIVRLLQSISSNYLFNGKDPVPWKEIDIKNTTIDGIKQYKLEKIFKEGRHSSSPAFIHPAQLLELKKRISTFKRRN